MFQPSAVQKLQKKYKLFGSVLYSGRSASIKPPGRRQDRIKSLHHKGYPLERKRMCLNIPGCLHQSPAQHAQELKSIPAIYLIIIITKIIFNGWPARCLLSQCHVYFALIGGVAQWLDVGLRLADFPWSMPDLWLTRDHFVGSVRYGSTNQANSAFHPSGVCKWVVTHVYTRITEWRPLNGRPGQRMAVWSRVKVCR